MAEKNQNKKTLLYEKFLQDEAATKEQEEIGEKYQVEADKIVVTKKSTVASLSDNLVEILFTVGKVIVYIVVGLLCSFAMTVLLNSQLRTAVFDIMKTWKIF